MLAWLALCGWSAAAEAQSLPSEPLVFARGRVTIGGDVSGTYSCANADPNHGCGEDLGFFNYSSYDQSLLRSFRIDLTAAVKAGDRITFLTEIRTENFNHLEPYALYVRVRPWTHGPIDIQAGRIPPTFGAFSRRPYPSDNPLIGYPMAYQYLISLRPDAVPASADELIAMRGRGWLSRFSIGDTTPRSGLPFVNGLRWDTGVQVHAGTDWMDVAGAITTGTLANPLVRDDNAGKQLSGRASVRPVVGMVLGVSAAQGPYVNRAAAVSAGLPEDDRSLTQTAFGVDAEYARGYYVVRFETVLSRWRVPLIRAPYPQLPLRSSATSIEGRYKLMPGLYAAARWDYLGFNEITGSAGPRTWEAPVTRVEAGAGYSIRRNILLKGSYQHNDRDGGRVRASSIVATQIVYWF